MSALVTIGDDEPRLFGIRRSNRPASKMWGKNCFNNAFPVALACFMWSERLKAVYVSAKPRAGEPDIANGEISVPRVFAAPRGVSAEDLRFDFESDFDPYGGYVEREDAMDGADVVVRHGDDWLRPLQIKLTVIPNHGTYRRPKPQWTTEFVVRPSDSCMCALGIFNSVSDRVDRVKDILRLPCSKIRDWTNEAEVVGHQRDMMRVVGQFLTEFSDRQIPYVLHPIWMTVGKQSELADKAFDLFVWSDFALVSAYWRQAASVKGKEGKRAYRAVCRFARAQYDLATRGSIQYDPIYRDIALGVQTDKELSLSGDQMRHCLNSPRRTAPLLSPDILPKIILNGGQKLLSPERRLDQTIYFSAGKHF